MILFNVNHRDLTCFLGDAIRLIDGCLTEGFAGSLPESWAIPHFHCPGNMMESSSSQAQPIHSKAPGHASFQGCTGFAGCHGLHCLRTALAQVTVIAISKTLFPCFCTPSSLSMFIPYSFSCLTSPLTHFHPPTDSALWGERKSHHPKCISWHSPAGAFPLSRTHAI